MKRALFYLATAVAFACTAFVAWAQRPAAPPDIDVIDPVRHADDAPPPSPHHVHGNVSPWHTYPGAQYWENYCYEKKPPASPQRTWFPLVRLYEEMHGYVCRCDACARGGCGHPDCGHASHGHHHDTHHHDHGDGTHGHHHGRDPHHEHESHEHHGHHPPGPDADIREPGTAQPPAPRDPTLNHPPATTTPPELPSPMTPEGNPMPLRPIPQTTGDSPSTLPTDPVESPWPGDGNPIPSDPDPVTSDPDNGLPANPLPDFTVPPRSRNEVPENPWPPQTDDPDPQADGNEPFFPGNPLPNRLREDVQEEPETPPARTRRFPGFEGIETFPPPANETPDADPSERPSRDPFADPLTDSDVETPARSGNEVPNAELRFERPQRPAWGPSRREEAPAPLESPVRPVEPDQYGNDAPPVELPANSLPENPLPDDRSSRRGWRAPEVRTAQPSLRDYIRTR